MATVTLRDIRKSYGALEVVKGVDLEIRDREFVVLVGPSGCGKTTMLRMIAGLETITAGELSIDGRRVNEVEPDERGLAMVFQSYALYPHMSVADNMGFALRMAGVGKAERAAKVRDAARILQLEPYLDRRPGQLSGGQRQRVAIGRAIVRSPKVFLFDEPLSNLDAALRMQMRIELARLHRELDATMVYVTHDQVEAMTLADRIVVVNGGRIEQVGAPMEIYSSPATTFVAGFIGAPKMNLLAGRLTSSAVLLENGAAIPLGIRPDITEGETVTLGVRPEALLVVPDGPLSGRVTVVEHLGGETLTHIDIGDGHLVTVKTAEQAPAAIGDAVRLRADPARIHLFGADGRAVRSSAPSATLLSQGMH
ncbi:sn-glycerol-3-phosphate ABC transporter ATP-binding protein UgpC [Aureimonas sp. ME7]|uniref:ABC transporter ATP-binding protein n=1 Tax=Aureimonas sp. ME7 TaxID=2744252 RepID=UPI0015F41698|nr:sn-glycerol-3-phosphate ABC transporter ATP-binding protein UgpC [Aureimonas sp. ME7]